MPLKQDLSDPLSPWTGWSDYAFNDDVNAITTYIENQRPNINKYPDLLGTIEDYERWLTQLSWFAKYFDTDNSVAQAIWYRDKVNSIMGQAVDPSSIPGDIMNKKVALDPAKASNPLANILNSVFGSSTTKMLKYGLIIVSGGAVLYLFGPAIRSTITRKTQAHNDIIKGNVP